MPSKSIAVVPEYMKTDNYSKTSIQWLEYLAEKHNISIQHALNSCEKQLTINYKTYTVDGYCKESNIVYEYHGCFWHGCPICYHPNVINNKKKKNMHTLNKQTVEKRNINTVMKTYMNAN